MAHKLNIDGHFAWPLGGNCLDVLRIVIVRRARSLDSVYRPRSVPETKFVA